MEWNLIANAIWIRRCVWADQGPLAIGKQTNRYSSRREGKGSPSQCVHRVRGDYGRKEGDSYRKSNTVEQGHCVRLQNFRNFAKKERDDGLVASSGELRRLHPQSVSVDGVMGGS